MTPAVLFALAVGSGCGGDTEPASGGPASTADSGEAALTPAELATTLAAPGAWQVGYRTVTVSWSDSLLTGGADRELRTSLWYPTADTDGDEALYQGAFEAEGVFADATLASGPHPVAVFSHGHQAYSEAAGFLMEHLASHGWVVAAPDHTGNLLFDGGDRDTEIYLQRPLDISAVLDWLDAPSGDPLEGQLSDTRVGLGHSFGGYTLHAVGGAAYDPATIAGCDDGTDFCSTMTPELADRLEQGFSDPRLTLLVSMAPGDYRLFGEGLAEVGGPVVMMSGGLDGATDDIEAFMVPTLDHPDDRWLHLPTLGHNGFTDFAGDLDPAGAEDPETGWETVRGLVLAAVEGHRGAVDAAPLLDGEVAVGDAPVEVRSTSR